MLNLASAPFGMSHNQQTQLTVLLMFLVVFPAVTLSTACLVRRFVSVRRQFKLMWVLYSFSTCGFGWLIHHLRGVSGGTRAGEILFTMWLVLTLFLIFGRRRAYERAIQAPLRRGDIVDLPESDHRLNETWGGLPQPIKSTLAQCLRSQVDIVVGGQSNAFILQPQFQEVVRVNGGPPYHRMSVLAPSPSAASRPDFWLPDLVHNSGVLLTSSDLTRVKVKRVDSATARPVELIFDLTDNPRNPAEPLWLRDGDIIEIPDKP